MAGPFPGMDPYIESQGNWQDFHNRLITEMCNSLGVRLPEDYVARVDESIEVVGFGENGGTAYRPDVLVARHDRPKSRERSELAGSGLATIEPILKEVSDRDPEEIPDLAGDPEAARAGAGDGRRGALAGEQGLAGPAELSGEA
jgi:hypothetical protein